MHRHTPHSESTRPNSLSKRCLVFWTLSAGQPAPHPDQSVCLPQRTSTQHSKAFFFRWPPTYPLPSLPPPLLASTARILQ